MIIGNCHDETFAFIGGDRANSGLTWETLPGRMAPELVLDISPEAVIAAIAPPLSAYEPSAASPPPRPVARGAAR
jgi:para-nitrobenzyl esterase